MEKKPRFICDMCLRKFTLPYVPTQEQLEDCFFCCPECENDRLFFSRRELNVQHNRPKKRSKKEEKNEKPEADNSSDNSNHK